MYELNDRDLESLLNQGLTFSVVILIDLNRLMNVGKRNLFKLNRVHKRLFCMFTSRVTQFNPKSPIMHLKNDPKNAKEFSYASYLIMR